MKRPAGREYGRERHLVALGARARIASRRPQPYHAACFTSHRCRNSCSVTWVHCHRPLLLVSSLRLQSYEHCPASGQNCAFSQGAKRLSPVGCGGDRGVGSGSGNTLATDALTQGPPRTAQAAVQWFHPYARSLGATASISLRSLGFREPLGGSPAGGLYWDEQPQKCPVSA